MAYVTCTICGFTKDVSDDLIGRRAKCPKCDQSLNVMSRELSDLEVSMPRDPQPVIIPDYAPTLKRMAKDLGFLAGVARVIVALWILTVILYVILALAH